jgi:hypothetical protein
MTNSQITFEKLIQANISVDDLFIVQPDIKQWLQYKKVNKNDIGYLVQKWDIDVINDFHLDLGDIIYYQIPSEQLVQYGVTYDKLLELGLTHENMMLCKHITLMGWTKLGITRKHIETIPDVVLFHMFRMSKAEVMNSIPL